MQTQPRSSHMTGLNPATEPSCLQSSSPGWGSNPTPTSCQLHSRAAQHQACVPHQHAPFALQQPASCHPDTTGQSTAMFVCTFQGGTSDTTTPHHTTPLQLWWSPLRNSRSVICVIAQAAPFLVLLYPQQRPTHHNSQARHSHSAIQGLQCMWMGRGTASA